MKTREYRVQSDYSFGTQWVRFEAPTKAAACKRAKDEGGVPRFVQTVRKDGTLGKMTEA